ncbi:MAG TPA: phosphotransferase [Isosphaeraceae bacterium]|jgi:aminoglycoside phosphotransferase (APT) family kinase protein
MSSDVELARRIALGCFGLEPRIEPISRLNNLVFRLRYPHGAMILKMARGQDASALRKELAIVDLLGRHGLPAPAVEFADPDGAQLGRPFVVMRSAGDRTVADWAGDPGEEGRALFGAMGNVLARVHGIGFRESGEIRAEGIIRLDAAAARGEADRAADWAADRGHLGHDEAERFRALATPDLEGPALCHRDFHGVQCVVDRGRIAAVVDWESAWACNPTVDLAIAHAYLDFYCAPPLIEAFFSGYGSARPLPDRYDRDNLPIRMAHALGMMRVWYDQGLEPNLRRTIELFRTYSRAIDGA